jgi:Rrf2 family nitric oxide-sensitive transcriptional repressor
VVRKTETDFQMVECFGEGLSHCALLPACHLKRVLAEALEAFFAKLDGITLADLMNHTPAPDITLRPLTFTPSASRSPAKKRA